MRLRASAKNINVNEKSLGSREPGQKTSKYIYYIVQLMLYEMELFNHDIVIYDMLFLPFLPMPQVNV